MTASSPLKDKPLRNPGQSLDEEIQELFDDKIVSALWVTMALFLVAVLEWFAYWRHLPRQPVTYTAMALLAAAYTTWRFFKVRKRMRALRQGRDGERVVGQYLDDRCASDTRIFHDVPGSGFNLDHVVISPNGVFVVETKTISKPSPQSRVTIRGEQLLVAGRPLDRDPITQVRAQIGWLTRILEESTGKRFPVKGAVVFPGWFVEPPSGPKLDIWVLEPKALPAFIEREPQRLPMSDVSLAAFHLSRYVRTSTK
jgi:hypothetical protein